MKKNILLMLLTVSLLLVNNVFAAKVNNVELSHKDGFTVARIDIDGIVRYSHQTEVAKDDKPYRIIVDVLSATHGLGAKNFNELPNSPIKSIRTSQFSVNPEKVVRLVFDMDTERVYRIDSDSKSITLTLPDKETKSFTTWASSQTVKKNREMTAVKETDEKPTVLASNPVPKSTKSVNQMNNTINEDRMLSLEGANKTVTDTKKKVVSAKAATPTVESKVKEEISGPAVDYAALQKEVQLNKEKAKQAVPKPEVKASAKEDIPSTSKVAAVKPKEDTKKVVASEKPATAVASKEKSQKTTPVVEPNKKIVASTPPVTKKEVKPAPVEKEADKTVAVVDKPVTQNAEKPVAKQTTTVAQKSDMKSTSTSRFRRSPASTKKIKGTMVAEFPKRLVIKYKSQKYRDPFETLINENKNYNNPVEKSVPNVEGLKLVGIIESDVEGNRALFEDNSGYGYILKTGDKVRKGYVLRVDSDRVYFQIFEYGWSRTVSLVLES